MDSESGNPKSTGRPRSARQHRHRCVDRSGEFPRIGAAALSLGMPARLNVPEFGPRHWGTEYDVSPDGRHVLFPYPSADHPPEAFRVIVNWLDRW